MVRLLSSLGCEHVLAACFVFLCVCVRSAARVMDNPPLGSPLLRSVRRWHDAGDSYAVVLAMLMVIMAIAITASSLIVINVVLPAAQAQELGTERTLEIAISGVLVFAMLASTLLAFAAAPKSWKMDERYVRDCRAATCTAWKMVCGVLMLVLMLFTIWSRRHAMAVDACRAFQLELDPLDIFCLHDQLSLLTLLLDLLVVAMMAWWWLVHFDSCASPRSGMGAGIAAVVLPVAAAQFWLGHAWHDWLFIILWLMVFYYIGVLCTAAYDAQLEPVAEEARLYERQLEREQQQAADASFRRREPWQTATVRVRWR